MRDVDILDRDSEVMVTKRRALKEIVWLSICTIVLYGLIEIGRPYLPKNIITWDSAAINTIGLIHLAAVTYLSFTLPKCLKATRNKWSKLNIVIMTIVIIFILEVVFYLFQIANYWSEHSHMVFSGAIRSALVITGLSAFISTVRVNKIMP